MSVEILIGAYIAVCISMIGFNIVCIFVFRQKDKRLDADSNTFTDEVRKQIELPKVTSEHQRYMMKKLRNINNLMAFDKTMEELYPQEPEKIQAYMEELSNVFVYLASEYQRKSNLQEAYFPYIIKKYRIFQGQDIKVINDSLMELIHNPSLYCRENALEALYIIGNADSVVKALEAVDQGSYYHHPKLITDGLLTFSGDRDALATMLWEKLPRFSERMQVTILDYFRFSSGSFCERILQLMVSPDRSDEVAYSCIRYFGKYAYQPAYPYLLDYAEESNSDSWEYAAISATALANYPGDRTVETMKMLLHSRNWYVRYNASQSLELLGLDYTDLIDIFEGKDRYAEEIMRYRFDQKHMRERGERSHDE